MMVYYTNTAKEDKNYNKKQHRREMKEDMRVLLVVYLLSMPSHVLIVYIINTGCY